MKRTFVFFISVLMCGVLLNFLSSSVTYAQTKNDTTAQNNNKNLVFSADLSGKNVVPPVKTKASGNAKFTFSKDGESLNYVINLKNAKSVIMAHIHHAPKGKNGSPVVGLYKGKVKNITDGKFTEGTITNKDINLDSLKTWFNQGDAYVMVHTEAHKSGELRGQIHPIKEKAQTKN